MQATIIFLQYNALKLNTMALSTHDLNKSDSSVEAPSRVKTNANTPEDAIKYTR